MTTAMLSQTQRDVQALARDFAREEIAPHAERWNADKHVPVDVLIRLGELGLLGVIVPEEHEGAGLDYTSLCLVVEEIARADAGTLGRGGRAERAGRDPAPAGRDARRSRSAGCPTWPPAAASWPTP